MNQLPDPPLPADTDLSKLDGFMLNTERLLGSELVALSTGDEFKAATLLWCRAWKQIPACSLPNNDKILASFAGLTLAKWRKVRDMALRGFIECSDGRLYHMVLARDGARAAEAHGNFTEKREADRLRLKEWREAKRRKREAENETHNETPVKRVSETFGNADETSKTGRDGTVKEVRKSSEVKETSGAEAPSLEAEVYRRGKALLGPKSGGQVTKLRKALGNDDIAALATLNEAAGKQTPAEWIAGVLKRRGAEPETDELGLPISAPYDAAEDYRRMGVEGFGRG